MAGESEAAADARQWAVLFVVTSFGELSAPRSMASASLLSTIVPTAKGITHKRASRSDAKVDRSGQTIFICIVVSSAAAAADASTYDTFVEVIRRRCALSDNADNGALVPCPPRA